MRPAFLLVPLLLAPLPGNAEVHLGPPANPTVPLAEAVSAAPSLQAALARADAAQKRAASAGRLPDPQLEGMYSQIRRPAGGERIPMWEITLSQPFPKAGERAADRDRATAVLSMAEADYAVMAGELAADIASALAESSAASPAKPNPQPPDPRSPWPPW